MGPPSEIWKYSIIDTEQEEGSLATSVVPTKWIVGDQVLCPRTSKAEASACKGYTDPDSTWTFFKCTVRGTYDSYDEARKRLALSEETDGLLSDEERGRGKRKRQQKKPYGDVAEDASEDSDKSDSESLPKRQRTGKTAAIPAPPTSDYSSIRNKNVEEAMTLLNQLKDKAQSSNHRNTHTKTASEVLSIIQKKTSASLCPSGRGQNSASTSENLRERARDAGIPHSPTSRPHSAASHHSLISTNSRIDDPFWDGNNDLGEEYGKDGRRESSDAPLSEVPAHPSSSNTVPKTAAVQSVTSDKALMAVLQAILIKQEQTARQYRNLDHKVNVILDLMRTSENATKPVDWPAFPLNENDAFLQWELFLQSQDNYDFAVSHFSIIGGRGCSVSEMATNICKIMFSHNLASSLNWIGTDRKRGIRTMKCGKCIVDACCKKYNGDVNKKAITGAISSWLRNKSKKNNGE